MSPSEVVLDDPGESFWKDFSQVLTLTADGQSTVVKVLRDAPDPDDLRAIEDASVDLPPSERAEPD